LGLGFHTPKGETQIFGGDPPKTQTFGWGSQKHWFSLVSWYPQGMLDFLSAVLRATETQETHALALIAQGWNFLEFRDDSAAEDCWERALEAYQHACRLTENPGLLQLSTGQLAQMLHNDDVAIQYYTQSHSNNIEDERASFFLSQIYLLQKEWPQAKHWLKESVKRNATEPFALISLALAEAELGNCHEALQFSTKGCSILPEDPNIRFVQARVVRLCGNPQQAIEILLALPTNMQETEMFLEELNFCKQELEVD